MKKTKLYIAVTFIAIFLSCSGGNKVTKETEKNNLNIQNNFETIIADSISSFLLNSESTKKFPLSRKPKFVVGKINNITNLKINTQTVEKNIERNLLNSGEISFITSKNKREVSRSDRKNYNEFKNKKELKKYLKPLRADFFISGVIFDNRDSLFTGSVLVKIDFIDAKKMKLISEEKLIVKN